MDACSFATHQVTAKCWTLQGSALFSRYQICTAPALFLYTSPPSMFEVTEWRHVRRRSDANFSWGCTNKRVTSSSVIALLETSVTSSAREHPLLRKCYAASLDFNLDGYYKGWKDVPGYRVYLPFVAPKLMENVATCCNACVGNPARPDRKLHQDSESQHFKISSTP